MLLKEFEPSQVALHNSESDCWIIIHGKVYNVTLFLDAHPGGKRVLLNEAGKDVSDLFDSYHNSLVVLKKYEKLCVGVVKGFQEPRFSDAVPILFAEPSWYHVSSPYYKESHKRLRIWARQTIESEIMPYCYEWDTKGKCPPSVYKKFGSIGFLSGLTGHGWPKESPVPPPAGISPEEWDPFHELILGDELARIGSSGIGAVLTLGPSIALPPIIHFGTKEMKDQIISSVLAGDKSICLAITEPYAGSDVANLKCSATLTNDANHYLVNGEKKWITNGMWADYFVVAARTGESGMNGISLLLLEKGMPGLSVRPVICQGNACAGTAYVMLENVLVPKKNIIGKLNKGFQAIMFNFNHERLGIAISAIRYSRVCYELAMKYSNSRKTFGVKLFEHGVIRNKLGHMVRQIEASTAWLESIVYQSTLLSPQQATIQLGGQIALLKAQASVTMEYCAREASQILGGISYTKGGVGERVERIYRDVRSMAIPGGSEEIMLDLGVRQAQKLSKVMGAKL